MGLVFTLPWARWLERVSKGVGRHVWAENLLDDFLFLCTPFAEHGDDADDLLEVVVRRAAYPQVVHDLLMLLCIRKL
jgi:hypothetical protein